MTDIELTEIVSQRLVYLRKHLGDREGHDLTLPVLAERCGLTHYYIQRLENGLKGNMDSLLRLLLYYRSQGYSLDWMLLEDNAMAPMIVASTEDLFNLNNAVLNLSKLLNQGYQQINGSLHILGYSSLAVNDPVESANGVPEAAGIL